MDFDFSEEQEMLRKTARDFLANECPAKFVKAMAEDEIGYSPQLWHKMADLGWMGLVFPEKYGGVGASLLDLAVLLEEMGRACLPGPFFSTVILGGFTILEAGNESKKQELLPRIAEGDKFLTLALTEPDASYTADGITVAAIPDNGDYIINGTKFFVPDAHIANYIICVARTESGTTGEKGITLFLLDAKSPGISCTLLKTIGGDKQCLVLLDNVRVPEQNILGQVGQGWRYIKKVLQTAAVLKCAEMVGGAQQVLEMTVAYAKERRQFGQPIGSFQAIQHHCANMATDVNGSRLITYEAAWRISQGLPCTLEAAMAKAYVSDAYGRITALGHQVHGGAGFIEEHNMPLYYRRAKAAELTFGDADFHRGIITEEIGQGV